MALSAARRDRPAASRKSGLAEASAPQPQFAPQPGWAEADAGAWWANACAVARGLLARAPGVEVRGVGVAGMLPALLLLDAAGEPLRRSIQQNDARTGAEIDAMRASPVSLMPEDQLKSLAEQQVRDLFAYLMSKGPS